MSCKETTRWLLRLTALLLFLLLVIEIACVDGEATTRRPRRRGGRRGGRPSGRGNQRAPTTPYPPVDPDKFLEKYGYLEHVPGNAQRSPHSRQKAIKDFQRMVGLRVTGRLDEETQKKMLAPRCGNPDVRPRGEVPAEPSRSSGGRRSRPSDYYAPGFKWKKNRLTWRLLNASPDMDTGLQRLALDNALKYWSEVTPLTFHEVDSGHIDIEIKFGHGEHGDGPGNAFDGKGGVLAHAFFPEDGRTHFDEGERWAWAGGEGTTNLEIVAAHEFGHALGLDHSNVPGALMAPYYQGYNPNFKLHEDDILGIRSLYGRNQARPDPTRAPTPRPTRRPNETPSKKPDTCTSKFGAILQAHDAHIYVFTGKWLWRLNDWAVDEGFPVLARRIYASLPTNIGSAVYSWRTRYTYFFKGNKIFKYYGFHRTERKTVRQSNYPSKPDAAFMSRDGKIYVFQGTRYWEFDEYSMTMSAQSRPISSRWPGLPPNIESAVRLRDGYLYFIKGTRYRKYDENARRVVPGYPRDKAGPFMGVKCGGRYIPK